VAYCCSVKLYTLAVWVHLSQQYQCNNLYLQFLSKLAKRHNDFQMQHSTRRMSVTLRCFHLLAFSKDCSCVPSVFLRDFHTRKLQSPPIRSPFEQTQNHQVTGKSCENISHKSEFDCGPLTNRRGFENTPSLRHSCTGASEQKWVLQIESNSNTQK